ncbi:disulfide oxidoreductase [Bacillus carboniphilus]|uniref:Probable disulfide formation protein n=1 Tax=Bacillus carboniphilus TaxID=86663 RepID=A0ABN0W7H1_9BACI
MKKDQRETFLFIAWATSIIAMFGSLYFSEVRMYEPCELCWYQRILMYPLTVILGIGVVKKDFAISFYTFILSTIGAIISLYHYSIQKIDFLGENSVSCGRVPCTGEYINYFGFVTIPFLALIAFILISIFSFLTWKRRVK